MIWFAMLTANVYRNFSVVRRCTLVEMPVAMVIFLVIGMITCRSKLNRNVWKLSQVAVFICVSTRLLKFMFSCNTGVWCGVFHGLGHHRIHSHEGAVGPLLVQGFFWCSWQACFESKTHTYTVHPRHCYSELVAYQTYSEYGIQFIRIGIFKDVMCTTSFQRTVVSVIFSLIKYRHDVACKALRINMYQLVCEIPFVCCERNSLLPSR